MKQKEWENEALFMISALQKDGTDAILDALVSKAKPGVWKEEVKEEKKEEFPTGRSTEIVREKVFKYYNYVLDSARFHVQDVPFDLRVEPIGHEEGSGQIVLRERLVVKQKEDATKLEAIRRKVEKTAGLELTTLLHQKVKVMITVSIQSESCVCRTPSIWLVSFHSVYAICNAGLLLCDYYHLTPPKRRIGSEVDRSFKPVVLLVVFKMGKKQRKNTKASWNKSETAKEYEEALNTAKDNEVVKERENEELFFEDTKGIPF